MKKLPTPPFSVSRTFREFLNLHFNASVPGVEELGETVCVWRGRGGGREGLKRNAVRSESTSFFNLH